MLRDDVVWNIDAEIGKSLLGLSLIACREVGVGVWRWMEVGSEESLAEELGGFA